MYSANRAQHFSGGMIWLVFGRTGLFDVSLKDVMPFALNSMLVLHFPTFALFLQWRKAARVIYKYRMKCMKKGEQNVGQTEEFNLPRWLLYEPEYNQNSTFSHFIFSFLSNLVSADFERACVYVFLSSSSSSSPSKFHFFLLQNVINECKQKHLCFML